MKVALVLPLSTAECDRGPVARHLRGSLRLTYDAESDAGVEWTTIEFRSAVAARFTPDAACEPWMIDGYSRVIEQQDSPWLHQLASVARTHREALPADLKHLAVYFDHVGCWEVLAADVAVVPQDVEPSDIQ